MTTDTNLNAYKFYKEETGRWYIDIPQWAGNKADLEMVEGADIMLDYVENGDDHVVLRLSEEPFEGASVIKLLHDYSKRTGGGGIYLFRKL